MNTAAHLPAARETASAQPFLATRPFAVGKGGFVRDVHGDLVIVCSDDPGSGCDLFYSERLLGDDGLFVCPKCGRPAGRMEEVSPAHALL